MTSRGIRGGEVEPRVPTLTQRYRYGFYHAGPLGLGLGIRIGIQIQLAPPAFTANAAAIVLTEVDREGAWVILILDK